ADDHFRGEIRTGLIEYASPTIENVKSVSPWMSGVVRGVPIECCSGQKEVTFTVGRPSNGPRASANPYAVPSTPQRRPTRQPLTSSRSGSPTEGTRSEAIPLGSCASNIPKSYHSKDCQPRSTHRLDNLIRVLSIKTFGKQTGQSKPQTPSPCSSG